MGNKLNVNSNVFDIIDNEEKAYWLGFVYADGNIRDTESLYKRTGKNHYTIEVSLKSSDINHLNKFRKFLEAETTVKVSKVGDRSERCRLSLSDKHLWNILNSYGCVPNKSLKLKFPNKEIFLHESLIRHFIRGYVDGDGCISYKNKSHDKMSLSVLGTKHFLDNIQLNLPLEKVNKLRLIKNIYCLTFNDYRGYYVSKYLYSNAIIYLERKFQKYKEYCRLYEES
jgi:hypothetical protein